MENFLEKLKENKFIIICFIILLVIIFATEACVIYYLKLENDKSEEVIVSKPISKSEEETYKVFVELKGEVNKPGIYEVKSDKRIMDVIKLAEGLTKNADTSVINLSKKVVDEMVIIIYSKEEVKNLIKVKEEEKILIENCNKDSVTPNNACIENTDVTSNHLISINKATKEELMTLPGIGESKAINIIDYREKNGLYKSIEDLKKVTGIGESLYAQIKDFITT